MNYTKKDKTLMKKRYFDKWSENTINMLSNDVYSDLTQMLPEAESADSILIEFGTGNGQSTLELIKLGYRIIVLEINEFCARACYDLMIDKQIPVKKSSIATIQNDLNSNQTKVFVIEGDGLKFLDKKFNANVLVCWFIGASIVDTSNVLKKTVSSKENSINKKYREYIQEQIYKKFRINNQLFKTAQIQICDRTRKQILEAPGSVFSSFKAFHTQLSKNKYKLEGGFGLVNEMIFQGMDYVSQSPNLDQSNSIPMIIVIHAAHDTPQIVHS